MLDDPILFKIKLKIINLYNPFNRVLIIKNIIFNKIFLLLLKKTPPKEYVIKLKL